MHHSWIFGAPEAIVLLVHVPAEVEMSLIAHYDFGRKIVNTTDELLRKKIDTIIQGSWGVYRSMASSLVFYICLVHKCQNRFDIGGNLQK